MANRYMNGQFGYERPIRYRLKRLGSSHRRTVKVAKEIRYSCIDCVETHSLEPLVLPLKCALSINEPSATSLLPCSMFYLNREQTKYEMKQKLNDDQSR